ncbi:MAG: zinc ribbon domain-containing protein [Bacillota bacterium]|nr:zinc ribbon domain-containing protein [Bacillota bacterium]
MYCPNCSQQIPDDTRFCPHCGQQSKPSQAQQAPQQAPQQVPYQQPYQQAPYQQQPDKPKKKTGCLIGAIVAGVLVIALIIALIVGGGSCSLTTARLTDAAMASMIDPDSLQAVNKTDRFSTDTPIIYATALLKNAPEDTLITAKWYYVTEDIDIASVDLESTETNQYVSFSLSRPDNGFPIGDYEVELYVDEELSVTLEFSVK